jgi:uncharacterized membrane protein YdjX (TVP38/TMEM64 family)
MNGRALLKGLLLIVGLALAGYAFQSSPYGASLDEAWIDAQIRGHGWVGGALFIAVGGFMTAIGLPRQIVAFLAGYAFGVAAGTAIGVATALTGCVLAFSLARWVSGGLLREKLGARAARFDAFISANPFSTTLLLRLLPTGSNFITNLAAGASSIRAPVFFAATGLGYLPQTLIFALIGSGTQVAQTTQLALGVALFVVSAGIGAMLYKKIRRARQAVFEG